MRNQKTHLILLFCSSVPMNQKICLVPPSPKMYITLRNGIDVQGTILKKGFKIIPEKDANFKIPNIVHLSNFDCPDDCIYHNRIQNEEIPIYGHLSCEVDGLKDAAFIRQPFYLVNFVGFQRPIWLKGDSNQLPFYFEMERDNFQCLNGDFHITGHLSCDFKHFNKHKKGFYDLGQSWRKKSMRKNGHLRYNTKQKQKFKAKKGIFFIL